jgi:hypothetical protein
MENEIHQLKTMPKYFEAVSMGIKNFEIRENDRDFNVGDFVELQEHDPYKGYTGRKLIKKITYVFRGGKYGLDKNFVVFSIQ